ncbi:MAG: sulfatase-like hydrolase/transferase [Polyangiaceae bacterium]|nr:sulfatase-like hydrolase/transferase [Polyangiaceae bacterium]
MTSASRRPTSPSGASGATGPRHRGLAGERIWDAYLLSVALVWVELWVIAFSSRAEFVSLAEALLAQRSLMPIAALLVAPFAVGAGAAIELFARAERRGPRIALAVLCAAFGGAVAWGVSTGRHLAGAKRPLFTVAVAAIAGACAFFVAPLLAGYLARARTATRVAVVVTFALIGAIALELANARVLPRLYPAFHVGLGVLSLVAVSAVSLAYGHVGRADGTSSSGRTRRGADLRWRYFATGRGVAALAIFAISAALLPRATSKLRLADNIRFIYVERAPILGHVVETVARFDPPPSVDAPPPSMEAASSGAFDLAGWDVLLISVDAMRADHLGAYGYDRPTTPNIDAIAKDGVVFDRAYTATPHTSYAVTSMMTGKFTRPLLAMDLGGDSETWPEHLRRYDYKTAAFYPPAVFFIDESRFTSFSERKLGFEYVREEFLPAADRVGQVTKYLDSEAGDRRVFLWVHLFEPHEPYDAHAGFDFGARDIDRYDAEIAESDRAIGDLVREVRARRPKTLVILTADHGEEFGDHGGRYHGTTVYEEQVRVPLVLNAPGLLGPLLIKQPVQLVDLLPTTLAALRVPRPARVRGRDLGDLVTAVAPDDAEAGIAFSESEDMMLLAKGPRRLVCLRRAGACSLYDLTEDPRERRDVASSNPAELSALRNDLRALEASHGRYEREGRVREGKGLPEPLRRGLSGDVEAAPDIAPLLDDADVAIRRKSAEVLFELRPREVAPALRLAITREEDPETKAYLALALVRMGEGAPHVFELLDGKNQAMRRLAALALAEGGDDRGEGELVSWLIEAYPKSGRPRPEDAMSFERARQVLEAVGSMKSELAVGALLRVLPDVRLRPYVAASLAKIGEDAARPGLAEYLMEERYVTGRIAITEALLSLGAGPELRDPLVSMLGMPDPLPNGLSYAIRADVLKHVGGPSRDAELGRLKRFATSGVIVDFVVPELPKGAEPPADRDARVRVLCRAVAPSGGEIRVGPRGDIPRSSEKKAPIPRNRPELDGERAVTLAVPSGEGATEVFADLPTSVPAKPGKQLSLVFYVTQGVSIDACAVVPLRRELPKETPKEG